MPIDPSSVAAGLELASAAKDFLERKKGDHRLSDNISSALRTIYFTPDGVLQFLKDIEAGKPIDPERIKVALTSFNDRQWEVEEALKKIDFRQLERELRLNIATVRSLNEIRHGKKSLRHDLQNEINYYGQRRSKVNRANVSELIKSIEELNNSIENLERIVNTRART
jgi:hypothetical protein